MFNLKRRRQRKLFKLISAEIYALQDEFESGITSNMFVPALLEQTVAQISRALELLDENVLTPFERIQLMGLKTLFQCQKMDIKVFLSDGPFDMSMCLSRAYLTPRS
jgi:hypothetical protein